MNAKTTFVLITSAAISLSATAAEIDTSKLPPPSTKKDLTFEKDIKPIFERSCVLCHGAERPKGKLRLDSLEAALKGGISGKSVESGASAKSTLVHNISFVGDDDTLYMPPPGNKEKIEKLTDEQIGLIRAWIDQGAK
jgi:mono/diheme cytochrome c family protein